MSKFLSISKLFDGVDFKKSDKINRMYMHLMAPDMFVLRDAEEKYLKQIRQAWTIITQEFRTKKESRHLINELINPRSATKLILDTEALFGRLDKVNIEAQTSIYREQLTLLAQKAIKKDDIEEGRKCIEALMKLDGIDGKGNLSKISTDLPVLQLTTNPQALTANVRAEDIEHE